MKPEMKELKLALNIFAPGLHANRLIARDLEKLKSNRVNLKALALPGAGPEVFDRSNLIGDLLRSATGLKSLQVVRASNPDHTPPLPPILSRSLLDYTPQGTHLRTLTMVPLHVDGLRILIQLTIR